MGKQLQRVGYGVRLKNHPPPGCFWGMFHVLDYHHWNYVKKLLHHKKHHGRRRLQCFAASKTSSFSYHGGEEHIDDESQHLMDEHRVDLNPSSSKEISNKNRHPRKRHRKDSILDGTNPIIILHEKCNQDPYLAGIIEECSDSEHNSSKNAARFTKARSFPVTDPFGSGRYRPGTLDHKQNEVWFFPRGEKLKIVPLEDKDMKGSGPTLKAANHHGWNRLIMSQFKGFKKIIRRALKETQKETKETSKVSEVAKIQQMTRLSSLNESMDKYAGLFERSFSGDGHKVGGDVPKCCRRRHSLPDYETLISLLGEVSQETLYSGLLTWTKSEIDKSKELIKPPPFDIKGDQTESASRSDSMKKPFDIEGSDTGLSIETASCSVGGGGDNEPTWSDNREESVFDSEMMETFDFHTKAVVENKAQDQEAFSLFEGTNSSDPVKRRDNSVKEDDPDLKFVTDILKSAGFFETESIPSWDSLELPLDPQLFDELEAPKSHDLEYQLMFDLINEALLEIYYRSFSYFPRPFSFSPYTRPISKGKHVLDEVWKTVKGYSAMWSGFDPSLDDVVARDMAKRDGWMSLEWDSECIALELEDSILNDLIDELLYP